jgi:ADP-ribose pyrophosphatase YjhB (NUDIX family)
MISDMNDPLWLTIAREMQAIAQTGLTFTQDRFDRERYERLRELAAQLVAHGSGSDADKVLDLLRGETGYATPKIDVRGAAFVDGRVLLVREIADGLWTLPGGWADVNQSPAECVEREIFEESGFRARAVKLAAVHDYGKAGHPKRALHSCYKMYFVCEITGGEAQTSNETSEVAFFDLHALPPLSLNRTLPEQIERMFEHHQHRERPTDFD